jgi:hypothetical protein
MKLELTMTIGDLIVTGGTVVAIIIAYYAIKAALTTLTNTQNQHSETLASHDEKLNEHGENLAALDAAVFGRRRQDAEQQPPHRMGRNRRPLEGGTS